MVAPKRFAFIFLGNALPVAAGLWGGFNAGEILLLLYAEFLAGTLLNNRRVALHRRLSRKRGHFETFAESDGTLRARKLSFPPATGVTLFLFGLYGFFVWALFLLFDFGVHADLAPYLLLAMAIPLVEYLLQRPGLGERDFSWIQQRGTDTGGRLVAFGAMIPVGGVGLMFGPLPGVIAMAIIKGLVETLWHGLFLSLKQQRKTLSGFEGDPGIQREWRRSVAEYARATEHAEETLEPRTWQRLMREATGDYSHARGKEREVGQPATFSSDSPSPASSSAPATDPLRAPQLAEGARQTFAARDHGHHIELLQDDKLIGEIAQSSSGLQLWSGTLLSQKVSMKVAAPWNRFTWQICREGTTVGTGKQPRVFGLFRMPASFRLQLSTGAFHWASVERHSGNWRLTDTTGELVHGSMTMGDWGNNEDSIELPLALTPADALFLIWLRTQSRAMQRKRHDHR